MTTYINPIDHSSRAAFINSYLKDEGAASINSLIVREEIINNGGPHLRLYGSNTIKYQAIYDKYGDTPEAYKQIGDIYRYGEMSGNPLQFYSDRIGGYYDQIYGK